MTIVFAPAFLRGFFFDRLNKYYLFVLFDKKVCILVEVLNTKNSYYEKQII